jgi:hypothetical protein
MVKNYKTGSTARRGRYHNCRDLFGNAWELPNLEIRVMINVLAQTQFEEGDLIGMTTKKGITIASTKVTSLKITVVESDTTRIKGRVSGFLGGVDETMEDEVGSMVEIMREDIKNIWIETIR